ncbi:MAG: dehydrogenase [Geobacteraceae bacterium]|nr:dehydrogenase [Geobacteraceae bacterium]
MIIRSKAPLRLGFAGGGTDVSPYSELFGGAILNATINMFAYATIEPRDDGRIVFNSVDRMQRLELATSDALEINGELDILKGVYNRVRAESACSPLSFELTTYVDAPPGSGLGSSSTLVVAILGAFAAWLRLPLGEYDIAHLAWEIERQDLAMAGGKQDQYSAAFGGFNFMEFTAGDKVIVNPLRIKQDSLNELEFNILLYHMGTSRLSSTIIESQVENIANKEAAALEATHRLKEQSLMMKESILKGKFDDIGEILNYGWKHKKAIATGITNPLIDEIYESAIASGATGGKVSGAGGGGFMMLYCPKNTRYRVVEALQRFGGEFRRFKFEKHGNQSWCL